MPNGSEEFLKRLQAAFTAEAAEHCAALASGFLQLEQSGESDRPALIDAMFRRAHSLKGAARAVNLLEVEAICQRLESVFAAWRRRPPVLAPVVFDVLHRAVDAIRLLVEPPLKPATAESRDAAATLLTAIEQLEYPIGLSPAEHFRASATAVTRAQPALPQVPPAVAASPAPLEREATATDKLLRTDATMRVATAKVERVLYAAEDMLALKSGLMQRGAEIRDALTALEQWRHEWAAALPRLHELRERHRLGAAAELRSGIVTALELVDRSDVVNSTLAEKLSAVARALDNDRHESGKAVDTLLEETKTLLLLPIATDAAFYSKIVRDLARDQGKEVEFVLRGGDVEIDKRILQEMKDPLVHLLRNAIDHGMERPDARTRAGKPARGTITFAATQLEDNRVELVIEDDGSGIDVEAVKKAAVSRGRTTQTALAQLTTTDALMLIFRPEVTTAPIVTELSGRGLGLAIVWETVEQLGGRVQVKSERGRGTTFRITLPVAQSTFRGVLVSAAQRLFVLPALRIERVQRAPRTEIKTVENRETVLVDARPVAFARLADVLELPRDGGGESAAGMIDVVVVGSGESRVALGVDTVLREEEVLVKPLRKPLIRVRNIAGATVLGTGAIVPILNVGDLLRSAVASGQYVRSAAAVAAPAPKRASVLVAEDSITSRTLLKNILESAGYTVKTAVDGLEALMMLRSERFDVIVSDVEMPRLNGFGLTAAIRADRRLAELPVILVTALASREDRERGIDVGANAYLVKSEFEQSNLLETIGRFL